MMKNVNLTQIFLDLIPIIEVRSFSLNTKRSLDSIEPQDVMIHFDVESNKMNDLNLHDIEDVIKNVIKKNIIDKIKQITVKLDISSSQVIVYIEFMNSDWTAFDAD